MAHRQIQQTKQGYQTRTIFKKLLFLGFYRYNNIDLVKHDNIYTEK